MQARGDGEHKGGMLPAARGKMNVLLLCQKKRAPGTISIIMGCPARVSLIGRRMPIKLCMGADALMADIATHRKHLMNTQHFLTRNLK